MERKLNKISHLIIGPVLIGLGAGLTSTFFLNTLNFVTAFRIENQFIIYALPVIGLIISWLYLKFGRDVDKGFNLVLSEIHDPQKIVPIKMLPLIYITTIMTHLFGGSAGREGTAVQMATSLGDSIIKFINKYTSIPIQSLSRAILLTSAASAGFGSSIGTPLAGAFFGMEVLFIGRLKKIAIIECLIASYVGFYFANFLGVERGVYPQFVMNLWDLQSLGGVLVAGIVMGLFVRLFIFTTKKIGSLFSTIFPNSLLRTFVSGFILMMIFQIDGTQIYQGLGLREIDLAFKSVVGIEVSFIKLFLTALTISTGFKGGEYIPLVFMGATLGSALAGYLPVSNSVLASLGFAAIFGAASNTPITCIILSCELFGVSILPVAVIGCYTTYFISGHGSIYAGQRSDYPEEERRNHFLKLIGPLSVKFKKN